MWPFTSKRPATARVEPVVSVPAVSVQVLPGRGKRYGGASVAPRFGDFDGSPRSADAELVFTLAKLRQRSRALRRDNPHVARYFQLREDNVIGSTGIVFSSQARNTNDSLDVTGNDRVESAWRDWCRRPTVDGKMSFNDALRLIDAAHACDGDVFIELVTNGAYRDSIAFQVLEADWVDETMNRPAVGNQNQIRMGVEIDSFGKPVAYWFLTYHRGDMDYAVGRELHRRIPADRIIHFYKRRRPGQSRGEPLLVSVLLALKMVDGYRDSEITNRRVRAALGGFFEEESGDVGVSGMADNPGVADDELEMYLEPGQVRKLPRGVTFKPFDPSSGGEDYAQFEKAMLRAIASGVGVSYVSLANDLEGVSYSSIRQGTLDDRERWMTEQEYLVNHVVRPIFERWLAMWMLNNPSSLPSSKFDKFVSGAQFVGRRWPWVDPAKDVQATISELDAGLTSHSAVARQNGMDYSDIVKEIQADQKLLQSAGVKLGIVSNAGQSTAKESAADGGDPGSGAEDG